MVWIQRDEQFGAEWPKKSKKGFDIDLETGYYFHWWRGIVKGFLAWEVVEQRYGEGKHKADAAGGVRSF